MPKNYSFPAWIVGLPDNKLHAKMINNVISGTDNFVALGYNKVLGPPYVFLIFF